MFATFALALALQSPAIDFAKTWISVRSAIEGRYWDRAKEHDRMEKLLDRFEPIAKSAKTENEFGKTVNEMIDAFGDSHFGFFTRSDQSFYVMQSLTKKEAETFPEIGAWFHTADDGYTIQMVFDGGGAAKAGLRKGDRVVGVDGVPFTPVDSLRNKIDHKARFKVMRGDKAMTVEIPVEKVDGARLFLDATRNSERIIDFGGKKYGYIHLWTMASEDQKSALAGAVYGKFRDTAGIILDIRDGFGGRPEGFGDPFFRPEATLSWQFGPSAKVDQPFGYQRPLVVLINKGSRSAKEIFAYIMKSSKRATLVGERTGGNVLGTVPSPVGDWAFLEIPMVDVAVNGERLEKVGVAPDVAVAPEFDAQGKDLYVAKALEVLADQGRMRSSKISGSERGSVTR